MEQKKYHKLIFQIKIVAVSAVMVLVSLTLILSIGYHDIYHAIKNAALIVGLLIIPLLCSSVILFGRHLIKKLSAISDALASFTNGNFDVRVKTAGNDIFTDVGNGLNDMADKVQSYVDAVKESERKYRSLVEASPDCIKLLDAKGKLLHLNGGGLREHGFKSIDEALNGWDYLLTIDAEMRPLVLAVLTKATKGETNSIDVKHGPAPRGVANREWCNMTFSPVIDESGKIENILVVSRDITGKKKMESRVAELDTLKNKFIQVVSHQLRTPLSAIRWNLESLLADELGKLKKEQSGLIRVTHDADIEIIRRIDDFLVAIDIEEGRIQAVRGETSLESLVDSAMIEWKKDCKLKGIKFVYEGPREPLAALNIDAEKIRAALHNLMVNAIFYTSSGGSVDLSLSKTAKAARFTVKDTGIGIPAGEQTRIFTRFYRASNAATMLTDASGLGLYIAKRFVEMHGGKIGFSSKEGEGSSFWIELPLA